MRIIRIILFRVLNSPGTLSLALHPFIIFPSNFLSSTFVTTEMLNFLHFCPNRVALNPLLLCKSSLPVCKAFHPLSLEHEENVPTSPSVKSCLTTFKDIPQNSELIPLSSLTLLLIILIASVCVCVCVRESFTGLKFPWTQGALINYWASVRTSAADQVDNVHLLSECMKAICKL